jgi:hypothetical protein
LCQAALRNIWADIESRYLPYDFRNKKKALHDERLYTYRDNIRGQQQSRLRPGLQTTA